MEDLATARTVLLFGLAIALLVYWFRFGEKTRIPAIAGSYGPISSYLVAFRFIGHATDVVQAGRHRYRDGVFRVPTLFRWEYVASGTQHTAEVASAPEHILSLNEGTREMFQSDYTVGPEITANPYHTVVIRGSLTRNLVRCFPQVRDEIVHAFDDVLALEDKGWKCVEVVPSVMKLVARTSNRLFVGLPLCRNQEYLDLAVDFTVKTFGRGQIISLIPTFLRPILGPLIANPTSSLKYALDFLGPMINQRLEKEQEYGRDWPDRPNDLISWLLDVAEGEERTIPALAMRVLVTNSAAIHTSTMALTSALYDLTTYPEYILPMREEAERVVAEDGWSKASLARMHKIDSFIRESQRLSGGPAMALVRKVVAKDGFKFTDGTTIPYGAFLSVPGDPMHHDQANYENPDMFDGFRFSRMREQIAGHAKDGFFNRQMVSTSQDHLVFGHGRHACPGRFFAATEIKAMLAHILINYDVKAEIEGVRLPDEWFGSLRFPNRRGKIFIRKRE